jgi:hypothetical protein
MPLLGGTVDGVVLDEVLASVSHGSVRDAKRVSLPNVFGLSSAGRSDQGHQKGRRQKTVAALPPRPGA